MPRNFDQSLVGNNVTTLTLGDIAVRCAGAIGTNGAAITLTTSDDIAGEFGGSGLCFLDLQEAQALLGEGPAVDAMTRGTVVSVDDLIGESGRWPVFGPVAVEAGVQSALAVPMSAGSVQLGTLVFYNASVTEFDGAFVSRAMSITNDATKLILAVSIDDSGSTAWPFTGNQTLTSVVHQATGMIAAQLDCNVSDALSRLRAHAFSSSQSLNDVARSVVQREFRFS